VELAFRLVGLDWRNHVELDPRYRRPAEVDNLRGDASKARRVLGWRPTLTFDKLIELMVESDLQLALQERTLADAGHVLPQRGMAAR
jgi:GDPmannose 4,6-dehydratase